LVTTLELLETVNAAGGQLWLVDGERLHYRLPESLAPLLETLRERKLDIIEVLAQRPPMPAGVLLLSWGPKAAPVQISRCSTVTDVGKFIRATLSQLEAALAGQSWKAGNWGLYGLLERLAAVGCVVALDTRGVRASRDGRHSRLNGSVFT
jgi:hypothetical protein